MIGVVMGGVHMDVDELVEVDGLHGTIVVRVRRNPDATHLAVIAHGYGEHSGRYGQVADRLAADGATVITPDHHGHGLSDGERVPVRDGEGYVTDLHTVMAWATETFADLPVVLIGHLMGGLIASRYAQQHSEQLAALVLSGPIIGGDPTFAALAATDVTPDGPATRSRDPAVHGTRPVWHGPFNPVTLRAVLRTVDSITAGPGFGTIPTLWLHGETDPLAPLEVTRIRMRGLRGDVFEERVYAGAAYEIFQEANRSAVLSDVATFIADTVGIGAAHS